MGSDLHSDVALPVTFVLWSTRSFMPTGRFICVMSPEKEQNTFSQDMTTSCMPSGRFNCPIFPARKRIERGARRQEEGGGRIR
jgi:hypothetical protein